MKYSDNRIRSRPRRAWTLLVTYPDEPTNPRTFEDENGDRIFEWPIVRVWFSQAGAQRRARLLRDYGATVAVVSSDPITWPELGAEHL